MTATATRRIATTIAPIAIVALAGIAIRTSLAAAHPFAALLLFLWIVADTSMLALIARTRRPPRQAILAVLAGACATVVIAAPAPLRAALLETPPLVAAMAAVILAHVGWAASRARRRLAVGDRDRWVTALSELLPPALVRLAAAELAILHMALFRWGGPADVPADARAFDYHRHLTPICATLLALSAIEIGVYHLLLGHWSRTAAIVMFLLSDVGFVYLLGLTKSFRFRPILVTPAGVRIRAGFLIDRLIPFEAIAAIESGFPGDRVRDPATLNAAMLAWPNVILRLHTPIDRRALLRRKPPATSIAFRLDDPAPFLRLLHWRLGTSV